MKNLPLILSSLVATICLLGCVEVNPEVANRLNEAEELIFSNLDSALVVLDGIRQEDLKDKAHLARYNLLLSIADDRTGKTHTSLDNILAAEEFYTGSGAGDSLLAVVNMYVGRVYEDLGQSEKALESYLTAQSHVDNTENNSYWKGRIAQNVGILYHNDFDYTRASSFFDQAIEYFGDCNDTLNTAHSYNWSGANHMLSGDHEEALKALDKASEIYLQSNHTEGLLSNVLAISDIYMSELDDVAGADSVLRHTYSVHNNGVMPLSHHPQMSKIEAGKGNYEKAIELLDEYLTRNPNLPQEERAAYLYYISTYFNDAGQYSKAYDYLSGYVSLTDSLYQYEVATVLQEVEKKYEKQGLENEYRVYRKITLYRFAIGSICLLGFIYILIRKLQKRRRKMEYLQADLNGLKSQMSEFDDLKTTLSNVLDQQIEKEIHLQEILTNKMLHVKKIVEYLFLYENNPEEFKNKIGAAVVQAERDEYFGDLHEVVNGKYAGIVDYLKEQYPTLSDDELNICCLSCFGFNNTQMSILFGYTNPNSIFNKRHKLRKKLNLWPNYDSLEAFLSQLMVDLRDGVITDKR
jgi:tetratricopeptide (TPR) repeat protein